MLTNARQLPSIYYGLHMVEGVAEYRDEGKDPYRIYVGEETIKNMDATFAGRPVYVRHVDGVDLENLQTEADGYVIESFFNKLDGKHWAKFIVVSDKGREAVKKGWRLSNAYIPKSFTAGGECHGVPYAKEVTMAEYEHLAIVPNPRYEESIILTPEEYKKYNSEKELELSRVSNAKKENESMLNFFKKTKVENGGDLENTVVTLPKTKKEMTISALVNEMDDHYKKDEGKDPKAPAMANGEHMVKVNDEDMSVNDLVAKHVEMKEAHNKLNAAYEHACANMDDGQKKAHEDWKAADKTEVDNLDDGEKETQRQKEEADLTEKKKNEEAEAKKKKEMEEKKENARIKAEALKNAPFKPIKEEKAFELSEDKVERGRSKYGSGK